MLPDGTYDAIVVDADEDAAGVVHLELAILAGEHKSEVVEVAARGLQEDAAFLLAVPATLTVRDGTPHVRLEP